jgi:hypothetical protein
MALGVTPKGINHNTAYGSTISVGSLTISAGSTIVAVLNLKNSYAVSSIYYNDGTNNYSMNLAIEQDYSNQADIYIYYLDNVSASSGNGAINVTVSDDCGVRVLSVYELTGTETTGSFDKSVGANVRDTSISSGNTETTSQNDEVVIGAIAFPDASTSISSWSGTVTDNVQTNDSSWGDAELSTATKIISSAAAVNCAATITEKEYCAIAVATFKAASAAPAAALSLKYQFTEC